MTSAARFSELKAENGFMFDFIRENLEHIKENHGEKVGLLGISLVLVGGMVFLGAAPRNHGGNAVGEAWLLALPLIAAGLFLFGLRRRWNR
jgi:hypothetical protein